jgi:hypothetical protein
MESVPYSQGWTTFFITPDTQHYHLQASHSTSSPPLDPVIYSTAQISLSSINLHLPCSLTEMTNETLVLACEIWYG